MTQPDIGNGNPEKIPTKNFHALDPQHTLDDLEVALHAMDLPRTSGRILALNSLENRVYLVELEDNSSVVVKYYRPARWNREQITEEHQFLNLLQENEIPAVAPLRTARENQSLFETRNGILFCLFPKVRGRLTDELSLTQARTLGRYIGRMHALGAQFPLRHRPALDLATFGDDAVDQIEQSGLANCPMGQRYIGIADQFLDLIDPILIKQPTQTVHGDCHVGNVLWDQDAPFLIDFDDLTTCAPVQDLWLVAPGRDDESMRLRGAVLEGYSQFHTFDESSFDCVEALRGLRMIHYVAWIARRWSDPIFPATFPLFAGDSFWQEESEALQQSMTIICSGE